MFCESGSSADVHADLTTQSSEERLEMALTWFTFLDQFLLCFVHGSCGCNFFALPQLLCDCFVSCFTGVRFLSFFVFLSCWVIKCINYEILLGWNGIFWWFLRMKAQMAEEFPNCRTLSLSKFRFLEMFFFSFCESVEEKGF